MVPPLPLLPPLLRGCRAAVPMAGRMCVLRCYLRRQWLDAWRAGKAAARRRGRSCQGARYTCEHVVRESFYGNRLPCNDRLLLPPRRAATARRAERGWHRLECCIQRFRPVWPSHQTAASWLQFSNGHGSDRGGFSCTLRRPRHRRCMGGDGMRAVGWPHLSLRPLPRTLEACRVVLRHWHSGLTLQAMAKKKKPHQQPTAAAAGQGEPFQQAGAAAQGPSKQGEAGDPLCGRVSPWTGAPGAWEAP